MSSSSTNVTTNGSSISAGESSIVEDLSSSSYNAAAHLNHLLSQPSSVGNEDAVLSNLALSATLQTNEVLVSIAALQKSFLSKSPQLHNALTSTSRSFADLKSDLSKYRSSLPPLRPSAEVSALGDMHSLLQTLNGAASLLEAHRKYGRLRSRALRVLAGEEKEGGAECYAR